MTNFQITAAEVLEVLYSDSNPNLIYGIKVKPLDGTPSEDETTLSVMTAKPLNTSILRIPIKGEVVLILKAPSSYASGAKLTSDNYYFDIVSLQSSIHHNALPTVSAKTVQTGPASGDSNNYNETNSGNTKKQEEPKIDENFSENPTVKPLQPYVGDLLIEGRYGNSIRFTTTPKSGNFTVAPRWSGGSESAPITIFRNSKQGIDTQKINDFITEDFTNNENIIVMASGQNIEFEQGSGVVTAIQSKGITSWKDENWGTTPQTLISSGRLVFNSNQKEIIAFAKNGIGLSSETNIAIDATNTTVINANKIELGDEANEPLILGNRFKSWAESLIDKLSTLTVITPAGPSSPLSASPQWSSIAAMKGQIPDLLSEVSFTKKSASTSSKGSSKVLPVPDFKINTEDKQAIQQIVEDKKTEAVAAADTELPIEKIAREEYIAFKELEVDEEQYSHDDADEFEIEDDEIEEDSKTYFTYLKEDKTVQTAQGGTGIGSPTGVGSYGGGVDGLGCPTDIELVKRIYDRLLQNGLDDNNARGVLANIKGESSFIPSAYSIDTNGLPSGGLFQWNGPRLTKMIAKVGPNWKTNVLGQVDYVFVESGTRINEYKNTRFPTAGDAAYWWAAKWEITARENWEARRSFTACFPPNLKYADYTNLDPSAAGKGAKVAQLAVADADARIVESPLGSDFGGKVTTYLASAGLTRPALWCASAVTYWWKSAGLSTPPSGPAGCANWAAWAKATGRFSITPVIGAAVLYRGNGKEYGHIGVVVAINNGKIVTVEGNTSLKGFSRDGIAVAKKTPNPSRITGFVIPK
jgi:hypothetical protein